MDSFSDEDEESRFFDALEHIVQESDLISDFSEARNWDYHVWTSIPQSVGERRRKFIRWMGLNPDAFRGGNSVDMDDSANGGVFVGDIHRIMENSGAVLRTSDIEEDFSSSRSSTSSWNNENLDVFQGISSNECRNVNRSSNCGTECGMVPNQRLPRVLVGLDQSLSSGEFENASQSSSSIRQFAQRDIEFNCNTPRTMDKLRERWLNRWRSMSCMISRNVKDDDNMGLDSFSRDQGKKIRRVKVRHCRRKLKELSALFTGQDIQAHVGSILTMKFSLDGQYLASAGEDKIVKIWQVVEGERSDTIDIPDADPSCLYFSVNHLSELVPLTAEKDKRSKSKGLKRSPDSACIIFPPKVFRIFEKPLHVFEGHSGEILDLSWSKNNCLLSSSVDKTVRLWKVGVDNFLKVFYHTDYVTCIQFNPVNDDYFISGSIDGKVRMWAVNGCQVVDWTETRDIVTAVSYRPDGQGGIIGSITGNCHFFNISDNHFQLEAQMCLASKKKLPCKRITGFQFLPQDPMKVLVTCADSQVRIIDGVNVVGKYKGLRNAGHNISASFTSDGKHIVSASEDSNIYFWNYIGEGDSSVSQPRVIRSFECFSADASVAITWSGLKSNTLHDSSINSLPFSSSTCFSLSHEFPLDSNSKVSATWPEEKLPKSSARSVTSSMGKSQYKLFKTSYQSSSNSHAWGLVIVTAGWDGRIRSFHNYGLPVLL